jgi:hypothetical protein
MPTSKYYREQAQVLAGLALSTTDPMEAQRFTQAAMEHLERAEAAESQDMCEMEADMAVCGYARVSTDGQSLAAQLAELRAAKCEKVFQEKISGARSDRRQLTRLMTVLAKDDVLVVTRLDRLARSTRDLLNLLGTIAEKGGGFKSLRDTLGRSYDGSWSLDAHRFGRSRRI